MASPHGGKRGISPESAENDKAPSEPFKTVRGVKTPKLHSLQLDKLYKSFLKENAVKKTTSNIIPNLKVARATKPPAPSVDSGHIENTHQCSSVSADGWITPRKTCRSPNLTNAKITNDAPIDENNRFLPLSGVEANAEMGDTPDVRAKTDATTKTPKPPPIYTSGTTFEAIIGIANSLNIPKTKITVKENDTANHTITTSALEHQQLLVAKLSELGIQFFTYTPKGSRSKSILIKGIKGNFDLEYIKKEILDLRISNVEILNISRFLFDKKQPEKYHHLIQLSADSKTAELFKIKALAYQKTP